MSAVGDGRTVRWRILGATALVPVFFAGLSAPVHATTLSQSVDAADTTAAKPLSVVIPIVATSLSRDLVDHEELITKTEPGGDWYMLERFANRYGVTLAVDSGILASISEWGNDAPAAVMLWRDRVRTDHALLLPWGNADPFVFGITSSSHRISAIQMGSLAGVSPSDIVSWPTGFAGNGDSVNRSLLLGFTRIIADDGTFPSGIGTLSRAATNAVATGLKVGNTDDITAIATSVITEAKNHPAIAFPSNTNRMDVIRAGALLDELSRHRQLIRYTPLDISTLGNPVIDPTNRDSIRTLMNQHQRDVRIAAVGKNPSVILDPRTRQLAMVAGRTTDPNFPRYVRAAVRSRSDSSDIVSFDLGADYTILANNAEVPLSLTNETATEITVVLTVRSNTGIVRVTSGEQTIVIPANSHIRVTVPITVLVNGHTNLVASLRSQSGMPLGEPTLLAIAVAAQWEAVTLWSFVGLVALIMGIGIARTISERRRARD